MILRAILLSLALLAATYALVSHSRHCITTREYIAGAFALGDLCK